MIPELRSEFNRQWRPESYAALLQRLDEIAGTHVTFRCSETPIFLPRPLLDEMVAAGQEMYAQLAGNIAYKSASQAAIPPEFRVPNQTDHPLFLQADFG